MLPSGSNQSRSHNSTGSSSRGDAATRGGGGGGSGDRFYDSTPSIRRTSTGSQQATSSVVSGGNNSNNSSSNNTNNNNVFRKFILGHRANDYHTDMAAAEYRSVRGPIYGATPNQSNNNNTEEENAQSNSRRRQSQQQSATRRREPWFWTRWCAACTCISSYQRKSWFHRILQNKFWRALTVLCTFILLFGAQIRTLTTNARSDTAFDAIFMVVFVIFVVEIIMRCDVEPNYFVFHLGGGGGGGGACCGGDRNEDNTPQPSPQPGQGQRQGSEHAAAAAAAANSGGGGGFQIGSFLFWCEFASTLALLHEISFIFQSNFQIREFDITIDAAGIPVSGMDDVNESSPVELREFSLLFTVAKTARVARFIRSTTAIKLSSRVNWYWLWNLVNPFWYWSRCLAICGRNKTPSDAAANGGTEGVPRRSGSSSELTPDRNDSDSNLGASATASGYKRGLVRNASWGGLGLGTLALVQAKTLEEREDKKNKGFFGGIRRCLRWMGLMRSTDEDWKRNLAATKIQRAWRRAKYHHGDIHETDHSERDFAWKARSSTVSATIPSRTMVHSQHGSGGTGSKSNSRTTSRYQGFSRVAVNPAKSVYGVRKRHNESQVGSAMRALTGERVAIGIILALVLTVLFTYTENDATRPVTMVVLHNQTYNNAFSFQAIQAARDTSAPDLFQYTFANGTVQSYHPIDGESSENLRDREQLRITVRDESDTNVTSGLFSNRNESQQRAFVSLLSTIFIILVWFFGVNAFVGPVMVLVVIPIERMVRLLGMLTLDPLGYQSTSRYKKFEAEEDEITKNTRWTKDILRGMETSFLMLTILRIGSLMKVGFGSAGVEIIRKNLEKSQTKNTLLLSEKGLTVSCIFLFCDIRQFTDATECLQEEVFVFTNRIAAVVHSICHSFGGSANKNIGDAFLVSWRLEEEENPSSSSRFDGQPTNDNFVAKHNQADKALLSVVKICMALHHDDYYMETMSDAAREALLAKLAKRKGPVVQLGFGLHAGKAVQGAIGSQRKIDATYVSEAVERAEFLESSTKKYGVKVLMSDSFHRLLHSNNRRRCRKVDQIMIRNEDDDDEDESGEMMELLTFDMDIDALWRNVTKPSVGSNMGKSDGNNESDTESERAVYKVNRKIQNNSARQLSGGKLKGRRLSIRVMGGLKETSDGEMSDGGLLPGAAVLSNTSNAELTGDDHHHHHHHHHALTNTGPPEFSLPKGPAMYSPTFWVSEDMRRIRQLYSDGIFFQKFNSGLNSYYSRDWEHARQCFSTILERFEDGPSRYFLNQIEKHHGKPPRDFKPYGLA